uniref:Putative ovule protein n=1 Tax=Solanum chacoense TaxID=4108 RepID=A0A0V0GV73_SOLCH
MYLSVALSSSSNHHNPSKPQKSLSDFQCFQPSTFNSFWISLFSIVYAFNFRALYSSIFGYFSPFPWYVQSFWSLVMLYLKLFIVLFSPIYSSGVCVHVLFYYLAFFF